MKKQYGFTLIELMIVVAIIAILAAIAIPAYNQYIFESRAQKVTENYDVMRRGVPAEMKKAITVAMKERAAVSLPADADAWVAQVLGNGCQASSMVAGCPNAAEGPDSAYVAGGGDATNGRVGLRVTGSGANVTVVLPAYNGIVAGSQSYTTANM